MKPLKARHFTILAIMIILSREHTFTMHNHHEAVHRDHVDAVHEKASEHNTHNNNETAKKVTLFEQAKIEATRAAEKTKEFVSRTGSALGIPSLGIFKAEAPREGLDFKQAEAAEQSAQSEKAPSRTYLQFTNDKINDAASHLFGSGKTHETITAPDGATLVRRTNKDGSYETKTTQKDGSYEIIDSQGRLTETSNGKQIERTTYQDGKSITNIYKIENQKTFGKEVLAGKVEIYENLDGLIVNDFFDADGNLSRSESFDLDTPNFKQVKTADGNFQVVQIDPVTREPIVTKEPVVKIIPETAEQKIARETYQKEQQERLSDANKDENSFDNLYKETIEKDESGNIIKHEIMNKNDGTIINMIKDPENA